MEEQVLPDHNTNRKILQELKHNLWKKKPMSLETICFNMSNE